MTPITTQQSQPKKIVLQIIGFLLRHILLLAFRHPKPRVRGIVRCKDYILLVRNITDTSWDLPGGGYRKHETPIKCLEREIYEELGVRIALPTTTPLTQMSEVRDNINWKFDCMRMEIKSQEPLKLSNELLEAGWFHCEALPENSFNYIPDTLNLA